MTLTLSILRCPDSVPPETRRIEGGEFRIGRGADNDWVLPDLDRILSKRHCILGLRNGAWQIADLSTNGTFLNREETPIGSGTPRPLQDGDRLRLGPYEIELRVASQPQPVREAFFDDPFDVPRRPAAEARDAFSAVDPVSLPPDYDPLGIDPRDAGFAGPVVPDHSPSHADAFHPPSLIPPTSPALLPDDWDLEISPAAEPIQIQAPPPAMEAPRNPHDAGHDLFGAFLRGAGLPSTASEDPERTMRQLGAAFRALVGGLRQALIARASIKGEFRIEQTMIRARGNNPLKVSADDDDALRALLGLGRHSEMPAEAAIADALRDMRLHEIAVIAAMQSAIRALLDRLDPETIRAEAERSGHSLLPAQKKARAFETFAALHLAVTRALTDDFDSLFGKSFARAYEQALRDAESREP